MHVLTKCPTRFCALICIFMLMVLGSRIFATPPANNDFKQSSPIIISGPLRFDESLAEASIEIEEPLPVPGVNRTVWYHCSIPKNLSIRAQLLNATGSKMHL